MSKLTHLSIGAALVVAASTALANTSPVITKVDPNFVGGACTPMNRGAQLAATGFLKGPFYCDDGRTVFASGADVHKAGFRVVDTYENRSQTQSDFNHLERGVVSIIVEKK